MAGLLALCLIAGVQPPVVVPTDRFTLSWTHSIEKVEWREEYRVSDRGLVLETSRVKGSGVGMEPGQDAKLIDGWWVSHPSLPPLPELVLAASHFGGDHTICIPGRCSPLRQWLGREDDGPVRMIACPARN